MIIPHSQLKSTINQWFINRGIRTNLSEVTWMVLVEVYSVMVHTTSITATSWVLSVFACNKIPVSSLLQICYIKQSGKSFSIRTLIKVKSYRPFMYHHNVIYVTYKLMFTYQCGHVHGSRAPLTFLSFSYESTTT